MMAACWTCQLRSSACDGTRPRCRECESCGLVCEGYGARPSWMDGGAVQQEYVEHLRKIADYNTERSTRHAPGPYWRYSTDREHDDGSEAGNEQLGDDDDDDDDNDDGGGMSDVDFNDNTTIGPGNDDELPETTSSAAPQSDSTALTTPSTTGSSEENQNWTTSSMEQKVSWYSSDASLPGISSPGALDSAGEVNLSYLPSKPPLPASSLPMQFAPARACNCFELSCQVCSHTLPLLLQFSLQAPFYAEERGWLHLLNLRSELVRCSSLALAYSWSLHLAGMRTDEAPLGALAETPSYHSMTLSLLQEQIKEVGDGDTGISETKTLEILVVTVNLIFYQALQGFSDHWPVHLRAGLNLLQTKMPHKPSVGGFDMGTASPGVPAQTYLVSTFVWLEAFSSALFWDDLVPCDHAALLARFQAQHTGYIAPLGCKSWVVAVVCQANQIRRWKDLMTRQGSLSNILLVSRTSELERYIKSQLRNETMDGGDANDIATLLYAQAATIYVHVLASGPHPDIPEIRDTVGNSLPQIEKAAQLGSNWLAWATCIIGCMASMNMRGSIEAYMQRMERPYAGMGSYGRALATVRECWRLRDAGSYPVHWASAVQSSGDIHFLL